MSFISSLVGLGSAFVPGPWGKVAGGLAGLLGAGGDSGAKYYGQADEARREQIKTAREAAANYDNNLAKLDLGPETAINNLRSQARFYMDMAGKNAAANSALHGMFRSTEPGQQLANLSQKATLDFANAEEDLRNQAKQRLLGVEQQRVANANAISNAYGSQIPGLVNQGNYVRQGYDQTMANGLGGMMKMLNDPEISKWLSDRLKLPGSSGAVKTPVSTAPLQSDVFGTSNDYSNIGYPPSIPTGRGASISSDVFGTNLPIDMGRKPGFGALRSLLDPSIATWQTPLARAF